MAVKYLAYLFTILTTTHISISNACVCVPSTNDGIEQSHLIVRAFIEEVNGSAVKLRVHKVYKGNIEGNSLKLSFVRQNGINCGTNFTPNTFETIGASVGFSPDGTQRYFYIPECSLDGVRRVEVSQPILDQYLIKTNKLKRKALKHPDSENAWLTYLKYTEENKDYIETLNILSALEKTNPKNLDYPAKAAFIKLLFGATGSHSTIFQRILDSDSTNRIALKGREQALIYQHRYTEAKGGLKDYSDMYIFGKVDYSNQHMQQVDFTNTKADAKFDDSKFIHAKFIGSEMAGSFKNVIFKNLVIKNSRFHGNFQSSQWNSIQFQKNSRLGGQYTNASFTDVDFSNTNLSYSDFTGATFINADLTKANLTKTKFSHIKCDKRTKWPKNFKPEARGIRYID